MAFKKRFWLNSILFCLHKWGDLLVCLFSSMYSEWNILLLLPSEVSWIKSQHLSHAVTYSFSLSREGRTRYGQAWWHGQFSSSQLSTGQNGRLQLSEVGRFADLGAFSQVDGGRTGAQRLEEERLFRGHTLPLLYQWETFASQVLEAHQEREPRFGYEPVIASPLTTVYKHWESYKLMSHSFF